MISHTDGLYTYKINAGLPANIYTHDELPEEMRFVDLRSTFRKIVDKVLAVLRSVFFLFKSVHRRISQSNVEYCHLEQKESWNRWKERSTGLHVFIHGFMGDPSIWNVYVKALRKRDPTADVRAPFVPHKGNCALANATNPIRAMVLAYIEEQIHNKENCEIPISLYGSSNGARISLNLLDGLIDEDLEESLREKGVRLAFKVNTLGGILRGTTHWAVNLAQRSHNVNKMGRKILGISPEIMGDFQYRSEVSARILDTARKLNDSAQVTFQFAFYCSTEDEMVTPYFSCLPVLGKGETHHIVHGESHNSIVDGVFSKVIDFNVPT